MGLTKIKLSEAEFVTVVKVEILKIIDVSFPIFIEFELIDINGKSYHFIDKVPVVSDDYDLVPPCIGYMRCNIIDETENTFIIDTTLPDDIESTNGEHTFEVYKEQILHKV